MTVFNRVCKILTVCLLLLWIVTFSSKIFAQGPYPEPYQEQYRYQERHNEMPGRFSLDLSAKFLERNITEDGFTFNGQSFPSTDAWANSARLLAKLSVDLTR